MRTEVTPLILTYNEAPNIRRSLEKLTWARETVVLDSFSTDETVDILRSVPQLRVVQRKFESHTSQWNHGIGLCPGPWILALDADYVLTDGFIQELNTLDLSAGVDAYFAQFVYCVMGRPLRGTLYPPRAVLFRKDRCRYEQDGHTQRLKIPGGVGWLKERIHHDDRKPLAQWFWAQDRYAQLECEKLVNQSSNGLRMQDRLRRYIVFAPFAVFFYTLLGKRLILDGWPGWFYVFQRTLAEIMLSLRLIEARIVRMGNGEATDGADGRR